jgi:hypothetical protein
MRISEFSRGTGKFNQATPRNTSTQHGVGPQFRGFARFDYRLCAFSCRSQAEPRVDDEECGARRRSRWMRSSSAHARPPRAARATAGAPKEDTVIGHRHGHWSRPLLGTFGHSGDIQPAPAAISPAPTRRVRRALGAPFAGAVGKNTVSRGLAQEQLGCIVRGTSRSCERALNSPQIEGSSYVCANTPTSCLSPFDRRL